MAQNGTRTRLDALFSIYDTPAEVTLALLDALAGERFVPEVRLPANRLECDALLPGYS